ncbi:MAG: translation initiation factor IF-2 N-terminal domain-containing protein, partial [Phycisphaerales bacterium]|nr:translation initiation factor IF-2 N-terminal domain-containing protein [Phycisphaerales bacterium]
FEPEPEPEFEAADEAGETEGDEEKKGRKKRRRRRRRRGGESEESAVKAKADVEAETLKAAANIRIHQLAKELNVSSKDVLSRAETVDGVDLKNHMSSVDEETANIIRGWFDTDSEETVDASRDTKRSRNDGASDGTAGAADDEGGVRKKRRRRGRRGGRGRRRNAATESTGETADGAAGTSNASPPAELNGVAHDTATVSEKESKPSSGDAKAAPADDTPAPRMKRSSHSRRSTKKTAPSSGGSDGAGDGTAAEASSDDAASKPSRSTSKKTSTRKKSTRKSAAKGGTAKAEAPAEPAAPAVEVAAPKPRRSLYRSRKPASPAARESAEKATSDAS